MKTNTGNDVIKIYSGSGQEVIKMYNIEGSEIYSNTPSIPLRSIQVGDNLSSKTLYFNFPTYGFGDGETQAYPDVTRKVIECGASHYFNYMDWYSDASHTWMQIFSVVGAGSQDYLYFSDGYGGPASPNATSITLPSDFGTVTAIASTSNIFQYIKIEDTD